MSSEMPDVPGEKFESEPELGYIKVYRVRHGRSVYHEHFIGKGNISPAEPDLTEEGTEDIENAAETIEKRIDPNRDVVVLISSSRRRAESAAGQIASRLKKTFKDQNIVQEIDMTDSKYKKRQESFTSVNLVDEQGKPVKTDDPRYPKLFAAEAAHLIEAAAQKKMPTAGLMAASPDTQFGHFEKTADLNERVRTHLARLMLISRMKQPELAKTGKRLVIIEVEHNETLDELYEMASNGEYSLKNRTPDGKGTGAQEGEVIELLIPSDKKSNVIRVNFLGEGRSKDERRIIFDPRKKEFL